MDFHYYWDIRLDELKKECPGVLDKPIIMNAIYDEAYKAWEYQESRLAASQSEVAKHKRALELAIGIIDDIVDCDRCKPKIEALCLSEEYKYKGCAEVHLQHFLTEAGK